MRPLQVWARTHCQPWSYWAIFSVPSVASVRYDDGVVPLQTTVPRSEVEYVENKHMMVVIKAQTEGSAPRPGDGLVIVAAVSGVSGVFVRAGCASAASR